MADKKEKKILITGGHMTPALITTKKLIDKGYDDIVWVGTKYTQAGDSKESIEYQSVKALDVEFVNLISGKLWRIWNLNTLFIAIIDLLKIPIAFIQALIVILKYKPDLVISFGGHVALPISYCAKFMRKKVLTHEQVLVPGLANKLISEVADKIMISWDTNRKYFNRNKTTLTGNPSWVIQKKKDSSDINFKNKLPIISILGGNQGAHVINTAIFAILDDLLEKYNIIHQTGRSEITKDKYKAQELKSNLKDYKKDRYRFSPFISNDIKDVFKKSDIIIARGGGNTMTDIIAYEKKCIIIPIPWSSGDEQKKNGLFLKELGLGSIFEYKNEINPEELQSQIEKRISEAIEINPKVEKLKKRILKAPDNIFQTIEKYLN